MLLLNISVLTRYVCAGDLDKSCLMMKHLVALLKFIYMSFGVTNNHSRAVFSLASHNRAYVNLAAGRKSIIIKY